LHERPKNSSDAHRELLAHEDLLRVLGVQEQRRLSNNLTLNYKRVLYVVVSTPASEDARGKRVTLREHEDGSIHIEHAGVELHATPFPKDAHVLPCAIVGGGGTLVASRHSRDSGSISTATVPSANARLSAMRTKQSGRRSMRSCAMGGRST
jgi:hypothetical protein